MLSGEEIAAIKMAHPRAILNFKFPWNTDISDLSAAQTSKHKKILDSSPKIFELSSPFSTSNVVDLIHKTDADNREIIGASFLKPDKKVSADVIHQYGDISIVADGASMVAKPEIHSQFPMSVVEKCTKDDSFMPDVLWSTMLSHLIGKYDYSSPFNNEIKRAFQDMGNALNPIINSIKTEQEPTKIVELINQGAGIFLRDYFHLDVQQNKLFIPSGIIGVINLHSRHWASTGDVRIGHTKDPSGIVEIVNKYNKVNDYDQAVYGAEEWLKIALAEVRTENVGNIQGLPITVESGILPASTKSIKTNGKGAIIMFTDGEDAPVVFPDQRQSCFGTSKNDFEFQASLLARDPFLAHLFLLHSQNRYFKLLSAEKGYILRNGHPSKQLAKLMKQNPWRADDASFIVIYE